MKTISLSLLLLPKVFVSVLLASTLLLSQAATTPAPPQQPGSPAQAESKHEEQSNPASPSSGNAQVGMTSPGANEPAKPPAATAEPPSSSSSSPQRRAWQILDAACIGSKTSSRVVATRVLGLIPNSVRARKLAEKALTDDKPEVRAAAAAALGEMKSKGSIPKLREALDDDASVALAAAHALDVMHDDSGYDVYYEILTGQRSPGKGLIASQTAKLKDPKKMAQLGFEEGIGFIPFAGIGWEAIKVIKKDDSSPIRAAAAKVLANDPDPAAAKALADAAGDKSWLVRAAALEALAKRGDPSLLDTVQLYMSDERDAVKYTAAAAVLRLTAVREQKDKRKKKQN